MNEQTTPTAPTIEEMLALLDEWSPGETRPGKPEIWDAIRSTLLSHAEVVKERDGLREECRSWRGLADDALCRTEKAEAEAKRHYELLAKASNELVKAEAALAEQAPLVEAALSEETPCEAPVIFQSPSQRGRLIIDRANALRASRQQTAAREGKDGR